MKNLKLLHLSIDKQHIQFRDGINYIIGRNASGKSTMFNCIKYALGLTKNFNNVNIEFVKLTIMIGTQEYIFNREIGDR